MLIEKKNFMLSMATKIALILEKNAAINLEKFSISYPLIMHIAQEG
jgi:hypothetical protein